MPKPLLGWQLVLDARPHHSLVTGGGLGRLWRRLGSSRAGKDITMRMHAKGHRSIEVSRWLLQRVFRLNEHPINAADTTTQHRFRLPNGVFIAALAASLSFFVFKLARISDFVSPQHASRQRYSWHREQRVETVSFHFSFNAANEIVCERCRLPEV